MATSDTQLSNLRMYVNDMAALIKHIEDAIDRQVADERVQADPDAKQVVDRIHSVLRAQVLSMENHAAAVGSETGAAIKEAVASVAGVVAGLYDKVRKHPVSRMLRDDYTALSLAATAYSMLYTTALSMRELTIANVALRHLQETTPLVMDLSKVIPAVVVRELAQDDASIDTSIVSIAQQNTLEAWGAQK